MHPVNFEQLKNFHVLFIKEVEMNYEDLILS